MKYTKGTGSDKILDFEQYKIEKENAEFDNLVEKTDELYLTLYICELREAYNQKQFTLNELSEAIKEIDKQSGSHIHRNNTGYKDPNFTKLDEFMAYLMQYHEADYANGNSEYSDIINSVLKNIKDNFNTEIIDIGEKQIVTRLEDRIGSEYGFQIDIDLPESYDLDKLEKLTDATEGYPEEVYILEDMTGIIKIIKCNEMIDFSSKDAIITTDGRVESAMISRNVKSGETMVIVNTNCNDRCGWGFAYTAISVKRPELRLHKAGIVMTNSGILENQLAPIVRSYIAKRNLRGCYSDE